MARSGRDARPPEDAGVHQLTLPLAAEAPELAALRALVPGAFVEGELVVERLLALLGVDEASGDDTDRYAFRWAGRAEAVRTLRQPAVGALVPDAARSRRFDDATHVVVEGDNLAVLKLLQPAYAGAFKLVFIDPPYNTGHDFIYPDDWSDPLAAYLAQTGQVDEEGRRRSSRADVDGRIHSRWLSMMYPRLVLARRLMRDDGAIFVAIDHGELHHLRMLMNEVFGEEHFVAQIAWQKRYTRSNNTDQFTSVIDHLLVYRRSEAFQPNLLPRGERDLVEFKNPDDDPRGPWKATSFLNQVPPSRRPNLTYPIENPNTGKVTLNDRKAWRVNREGFERLSGEGRLWWGRDGTRGVPQVKTYLSEIRQGLTPTNFWSHQYAGHTDRAHGELKELFGRKVFDTPKPSLLVRRALEHATGPEDLVLDFFAGSGVTGQAVMELNAEDGGSRRAVLVQLPEPLPEGERDEELVTIADITCARLRRTAERLVGAGGEQPTADASDDGRLGFRVFSLTESSLPSWPSPLSSIDLEVLRDLVRARAAGPASAAGDTAIAGEIALRAGTRLDAEIRHEAVGEVGVWRIGGDALLICLEASLPADAIGRLLTTGVRQVVVRDDALGGDAGRLAASRAADAAGVTLNTV